MATRTSRQEGTISAMAAVLATALVICAGLSYDGGAIITATAAARDVAAAAARTGAQQLDPAAAHAGHTVVDPAAATAAAEAFLTAAGRTGQVTVSGASVTVTVTDSHRMRLLPIGDRPIAATATATAISDVLQADP